MRALMTRPADMRMDLVALTNKGPVSARKLTRAHVLLQATAWVPDRPSAANATVSPLCTTAKARRKCTRGIPLSLRVVVHARAMRASVVVRCSACLRAPSRGCLVALRCELLVHDAHECDLRPREQSRGRVL
jgi:hypothetical protein